MTVVKILVVDDHNQIRRMFHRSPENTDVTTCVVPSVKDKIRWRDLLPNRLSIVIMAAALTTIVYLLQKGVLPS